MTDAVLTNSEAQASQSEIRYSGWWMRALGLIIDLVPVWILWGLGGWFGWATNDTVTRVVHGSTFVVQVARPVTAIYYVMVAIAIAFFFINKGVFEGKTGRSLGKFVTKDRTVRLGTENPSGIGRGLLRALLLLVELALITILVGLIPLMWPLWDPKKQTLLSDKLTRTVVVRGQRAN